jgi:ubiquinone/menaquinone biosynthesis C-methylase UbiE
VDYGSLKENVVPGSDLGLGCGTPTAHADLRPGETVLDLGSGAGVDVFLAAREVGPSGRVLGVDMTPEMIARARENAAEAGLANVEFRLGDIEALPVEDASVDAVLSNCVINLVPDKRRAFAEIRRVLRPGGRFVVSDMVTYGDVPAAIRQDLELWAGCVAGAMDREAYLALVRETGFERVRVKAESTYPNPDREEYGLQSVTVEGWKPA